MKKILLSTVLTVSFATSATAQEAPSVNWGGFYLGGTLNKASGTQDYVNPDFHYELDGISSLGGFVGYNIQRSRYVYGVELGVTGAGSGLSPEGFLGEDHGNITDIKARAGIAVNKALFYGVLGYSKTSYDNNVNPAVTMDGISYGVGVDYMINKKLFIGTEFLIRDIEGPGNVSQPLQTRETKIKSLSIRIGWKF
ncbi:MAG TPA: porin family protein [Calditrichaeota bacterium]|nr:porin family protein [Calditrichota bacterium]